MPDEASIKWNQKKRSYSSAKSTEGKGSPSTARTLLSKVQVAFGACARCSAFWARYQATHPVEHLQVAVDEGVRWIDLSWDQPTRQALDTILERQLDRELYHFTISCPECWRVYLYLAGEEGGVTFQAEIMPGG